MYCPECGTRLEDDALFCPECGTKVMHEEEVVEQQQPSRPAQQQQTPPQPQEQPDTRPVFARGLILTNIATLSSRLKIDEVALKGIIENYIEDLKNLGLSYRLIDASDYTYMQSNIFGKHKHVSLSGRDPWYAYADLTLDQHEWEKKKGMPESEYLFIIGGSRDVPMPTLPNFLASHMSGKDKTMDTDLLYAYPYGEKMEQDLLSQRLFRYDALFYVGRLPIADNGTLDDLTGYLERSVRLECSVPVGAAYSQCDPHWKKITEVITAPLAQSGLFPDYPNVPEQVLFRKRIFLTPAVVLDENEEHPFFNTNAGYIFFNLHGSGDMNSYNYYGQEMGDRGQFYEAFSPRMVAASERPNILFTQACYGGRFVGFPKQYSMVLTALDSMTMVFIGSSRTALGGVDSGGALSTSDILAAAFNTEVLSGKSVGAAFFAARIATFKHKPGDPAHALTIAEFNLFGDPMMHLAVPNSEFVTAHVSKAAPLGQNDVLNVPQEEVLMNKSVDAKPQSMLDQLRNAVDANIMKIHEVIAKQLYEQYNIPAREPLIITRKKYPDGHSELGYDYPLNGVPGSETNVALVTANEKGDIQDVQLTK
ncbi:MAG: zinc-ribbon domain-containing protein [Paludibacteraceae bacterium]|nr:zinc-ribbon domain-containing protein [Paludibacteraceae bacterium]